MASSMVPMLEPLVLFGYLVALTRTTELVNGVGMVPVPM